MQNINVRRLKNKDEFHVFADIHGKKTLIGYILFWFEQDSGWLYRGQVHTDGNIYSQISYTCEKAVQNVERMYREKVFHVI